MQNIINKNWAWKPNEDRSKAGGGRKNSTTCRKDRQLAVQLSLNNSTMTSKDLAASGVGKLYVCEGRINSERYIEIRDAWWGVRLYDRNVVKGDEEIGAYKTMDDEYEVYHTEIFFSPESYYDGAVELIHKNYKTLNQHQYLV